MKQFCVAVLERVFKLEANATNVRTECVAGLTTFMAMAYILFVVPQMLSTTGIPQETAVVATILVTVTASVIMGLWANLPVAVAPGIGLTVFFSYYVCGVMGLHWTVALGAVFISGIVFLLLTITRLRQHIIQAVPPKLKRGIVVGIGMFIAFIGLQNAGIVVKDPSTGVSLGNMLRPEPVLTCVGLIFTTALMARGVSANMLIGILFTTVLGMALGVCPAPTSLDAVMRWQWPDLSATFLQLDLAGAFQYGLFSIIFTFTIVELFDNIGVLIGVTKKAGLIDAQGQIKNVDRALITDSLATMLSGLVGTPTATSYLESAAGAAQGGRTGLTAIVVALLFSACLIFAPLVNFVPSFATAIALILVGAMMMTEVSEINFTDITEGFPAFMIIIMMPLTYSIANGFGFGFVSYVCIKTLTGRIRETNIIMWVITVLFLINFAIRGH